MRMSKEQIDTIFRDTEEALKFVNEVTKDVVINENSLGNTEEFRKMQEAMDDLINALVSL